MPEGPRIELALTSDLPATGNRAVFERMRRPGPSPRIGCIAPVTAEARERLPRLRRLFASHGFSSLEVCDIDEEPDERQLGRLDDYDILFLTGGDPIAFRRSILRAGLAEPLRRFLDTGRLVVGASGGSMQLTRNLSLFRLLAEPLDAVVEERGRYEGLGLVDYEILPHWNRHEPAFIETVRRYSERVGHEILALADGAAVLHSGRDRRCVGQVMSLRAGETRPLEPGDVPSGPSPAFFEPEREDAARPAGAVVSCIERGARALLFDRDVLPPQFFDLSTGVAGELVQKLANYGIRMAAVVPDLSPHSPRFREFAREAATGRSFRFFPTRREAVAWLESP